MKLTIVFVLLSAAVSVAGQDCQQDRAEYESKNRAVIARNDYDPGADPEKMGRLTDDLHSYLQFRILARLNAKPNVHASDLKQYIECIQDSQLYRDWKDETSLASAWEIPGMRNSILTAYAILRGYLAVPNMRPYVELYRRTDDHWVLAGGVGSELSGLAVHIQQIPAGKPGETWFFLSGKRIGQQPRQEQRFSVLACDGISVKEIWSKSGITALKIESVYGSHIVLTGVITGANGHDQEIEERYDIVPDGLKLSGREVIKTY